MSKLPIEDFDSSVTIPLSEQQKVRLGDLAAALTSAQQQGYVEASILAQALDLVKQLAPALLGV